MSNLKHKPQQSPVAPRYVDYDFLHEMSRRAPTGNKRSLLRQHVFLTQQQEQRRVLIRNLLLAVLLPVLAVAFVYYLASGEQKISGVERPRVQRLLGRGRIHRAFSPDSLDLSLLHRQPVFGLLPQLKSITSSELFYRIKSGDTLAGLASRFSLAPGEAESLHEAMKELAKKEKDFSDRLMLEQGVALSLTPDGTIAMARLDAGKAAHAVFVRNAEGSFKGNLEEKPHELRERVSVGEITSSLVQAAQDTGVPYDVIDQLVDLFAGKVNFQSDIHPGDRFVLVYEDKVAEDGSRFGEAEIAAARLDLKKKGLTAIRFIGSDGKARYFDEKGELLGDSFLRYPVKYTRISSVFTDARFHPVLRVVRPHLGVDFAAPVGTPVRSAADGVIEFAGWKGPNGKLIKIKHGARYSTAYAHLSVISTGIRSGAKVSRGQVIGAVGTTGRSTGAHLHYAFYDRGRYIDPLNIKLPTMDTLSRGQRITNTFLRRALASLKSIK
ncbi:MAG: peptidoglycan DD-metalloendopeptidase family protein [bacterium]|nr:peptidoglycan DD-metalloendopeptidase family protein [bacterium]